MSGENQKQETAFQSISGNLLASPSPNSARILLMGTDCLWSWLGVPGGGQTHPRMTRRPCPRGLGEDFRSQTRSSWRWPGLVATWRSLGKDKRSSEVGAGQLAPRRQGSQTQHCSACLCKVYLACLGLGCFTAFLVPAVFSHRKIIHSHVEKTLFCPLFLWKSIYPLWYSGTFPRMVTMLHSNNTVCLADFKQLWYTRLFNCIFFCC